MELIEPTLNENHSRYNELEQLIILQILTPYT